MKWDDKAEWTLKLRNHQLINYENTILLASMWPFIKSSSSLYNSLAFSNRLPPVLKLNLSSFNPISLFWRFLRYSFSVRVNPLLRQCQHAHSTENVILGYSWSFKALTNSEMGRDFSFLLSHTHTHISVHFYCSLYFPVTMSSAASTIFLIFLLVTFPLSLRSSLQQSLRPHRLLSLLYLTHLIIPVLYFPPPTLCWFETSILRQMSKTTEIKVVCFIRFIVLVSHDNPEFKALLLCGATAALFTYRSTNSVYSMLPRCMGTVQHVTIKRLHQPSNQNQKEFPVSVIDSSVNRHGALRCCTDVFHRQFLFWINKHSIHS